MTEGRGLGPSCASCDPHKMRRFDADQPIRRSRHVTSSPISVAYSIGAPRMRRDNPLRAIAMLRVSLLGIATLSTALASHRARNRSRMSGLRKRDCKGVAPSDGSRRGLVRLHGLGTVVPMKLPANLRGERQVLSTDYCTTSVSPPARLLPSGPAVQVQLHIARFSAGAERIAHFREPSRCGEETLGRSLHFEPVGFALRTTHHRLGAPDWGDAGAMLMAMGASNKKVSSSVVLL
ncbi:hypothetical protein V8E36_003886 [Tilletia maclaganii]